MLYIYTQAPAIVAAKAIGHKSFHIQAAAYNNIKARVLDSSFHNVVERRIRALSLKVVFPNLEYVLSYLEDGLSECRELHKVCGSALMSSWLKTLANGWCTSGRMHEDIRLPCIFGCQSAPDDFAHYLVCDTLWDMLRKHFREYISHLPQSRLALPFPTPYNVLIVGCAFHTYHALKIGLREVVDEAIQAQHFDSVIRLATESLSDFVASHGTKIIHEHTTLHGLCMGASHTHSSSTPLSRDVDPSLGAV